MRWIRRWFWSPVRDNENWAQTLVRVSGNIFRIAITVVLLAAAAVVVSVQIGSLKDREETDEKRLGRRPCRLSEG
jgi:hypothetical protein